MTGPKAGWHFELGLRDGRTIKVRSAAGPQASSTHVAQREAALAAVWELDEAQRRSRSSWTARVQKALNALDRVPDEPAERLDDFHALLANARRELTAALALCEKANNDAPKRRGRSKEPLAVLAEVMADLGADTRQATILAAAEEIGLDAPRRHASQEPQRKAAAAQRASAAKRRARK